MKKTVFKKCKQLTLEELKEASGGLGPILPRLPGYPRRRRPDPPEESGDEPKDGGTSGS